MIKIRLFHSFEPSQSVGGAKMEDPREKPSDHPQTEHTFYESDDIFNVIETNSLFRALLPL